MPGVGGPSGSSGTGTGGTANVYTPGAQPQFDQSYQDILRQIASSAGSNFAAAPPPSGFYGPAISGAQQTANLGAGFGPTLTNAAQGLIPDIFANPGLALAQQGANQGATYGGN